MGCAAAFGPLGFSDVAARLPPYPTFPSAVEQIFFCVLACVGQDAAAFLALSDQKSVGWGELRPRLRLPNSVLALCFCGLRINLIQFPQST